MFWFAVLINSLLLIFVVLYIVDDYRVKLMFEKFMLVLLIYKILLMMMCTELYPCILLVPCYSFCYYVWEIHGTCIIIKIKIIHSIKKM